ncbi:copper resistance CopC family protein [Calidifontibacter indicus]|uniref:CopC domain-containing protein n=1 Tax=Calidifontibacter indicus TaxID=419650 RepID=A0A3D9US19_9MICO|nr:copper resistance CopC family protein [Calidifontibacter indicus]REF32262.1 hypothetical protein DFJ65_3372 [Calidifontibacter indicus]
MRILARLSAALLLLPLLFLAPGEAQAHDTLLSTTPKSGATTAPVQSVSMVFNEAVLSTGAAVTVDGPDGAVAQGSPSINAATVSQDLRQPLANGSYKVTWRVLSSDGHPISGSFSFVVAGATASSSSTTSSATAGATQSDETLTTPSASSSAPTPPVQQVPTSSTDNNAPLIITAAVLALLLIAGGAFLARTRLKDDNADLADGTDTPAATPISSPDADADGSEIAGSAGPNADDETVSGQTSHDADRDPDD